MISLKKYPTITITVPADIVEAMQRINLEESGSECDLNNPSHVEAMGHCIVEQYAAYLDANGYPRRKPRKVKVADVEGRAVYVTIEASSCKEAADHAAEVIQKNAQSLFNI